jgi:hypothetical protein
MNGVAILVPLIIGIVATVCTIIIHAVAVLANLHYIRHERAIGRAGATFWIDCGIVATTLMIALGAHFIEICLWAVLSVVVGEFEAFGTALYHSAVNYTTLGYGDIVMSQTWKMLGPITATDGLLMFGVSTAMIFAIIQQLVQIRFPDIRA